MSSDQQEDEYVTVARFQNARSIEITIHLEPWGDQYAMPPGAVVEAVARGPQGDGLEVVIAEDHISVWGWSGSIVSLFHNGNELGRGLWPRSPTPPFPRGVGEGRQ